MHAMSVVAPLAADCDGIDLDSYDRFAVAFSGGKDSLALVLRLLDLGVPRHKIELHHHDVDGHGERFMDWPITPAYCRAVAAHLGLPLYFSWKVGGFLGEMHRDNSPTAPTAFEATPGGAIVTVGGHGPAGTRGKFPQVTADLKLRWCSAYLKIDVLAALIRNSPRFQNSRTLVLTGERAAESPARAKYKIFEAHRADLRDSPNNTRLVDIWRAIHRWSEAEVWALIKTHGVMAHPAYQIGWNRLSCRQCIFGSANQWATIAAVYPAAFERVAERETATGLTIHRNKNIRQQAASGTPYAAALAQPDLVAKANEILWHGPIFTLDWQMPAGAFGETAGPT